MPELMDIETARQILKMRKGKRPPPGRMSGRAVRSAIRHAVGLLNAEDCKLSEEKRYRLFCSIEKWRLELAQIEHDQLLAELTVEEFEGKQNAEQSR